MVSGMARVGSSTRMDPSMRAAGPMGCSMAGAPCHGHSGRRTVMGLNLQVLMWACLPTASGMARGNGPGPRDHGVLDPMRECFEMGCAMGKAT